MAQLLRSWVFFRENWSYILFGFLISTSLVPFHFTGVIHEPGHYWAALLRGQRVVEMGLVYTHWEPDHFDPVALAGGPVFIFMVGLFTVFLLHRYRRFALGVSSGLFQDATDNRKCMYFLIFFLALHLMFDGVLNLIPDRKYPQKDGTKIFFRIGAPPRNAPVNRGK